MKKGKRAYTISVDPEVMKSFRVCCELEDFFVSEKLEAYMRAYVEIELRKRKKELRDG